MDENLDKNALQPAARQVGRLRASKTFLFGLLTVGALFFGPVSAWASYDIHAWSWAYDDNAGPTCNGSQSTAIDVQRAGTGTRNPVVRLRLVWYVNAGGGAPISDTDFTLLYDDNSGFTSPTEIGAPGTTTEKFRFRDSTVPLVSHGTIVSTTGGCTTEGTAHSLQQGNYVEQKEAGSWTFSRRKYYEMDFSFEYIGDETATYYFRPQWGATPTTFIAASGHSQASINTKQAPYINTLTASNAPNIGDSISVAANLQNPNDQNYASTTVEYVVFIDNNPADSAPSDGTETYITCSTWSGTDCTTSGSATYTTGNTTRSTTGITVNAGQNTNDTWTIINTGFPSNTTYTIEAKWKDSSGNVLDTKTATFSSIPTLGAVLSAIGLGMLLLLSLRRGHLSMRSAAT